MEEHFFVKIDAVHLGSKVVPVILPQLNHDGFEIQNGEVPSGSLQRPKVQPVIVATIDELVTGLHKCLATTRRVDVLTALIVVCRSSENVSPDRRCQAAMKLFQQ